jgi:WhiB family redox-sensing transcriptional regulator
MWTSKGVVVKAANRLYEERAGDWRQHAACNGCDVELFFPVGVTGPAIDQIEAAKAVCHTCPVRAECLDFALVTNQECGVWGGASEEERRRLRRSWLAQRRLRLQNSGPPPAF